MKDSTKRNTGIITLLLAFLSAQKARAIAFIGPLMAPFYGTVAAPIGCLLLFVCLLIAIVAVHDIYVNSRPYPFENKGGYTSNAQSNDKQQEYLPSEWRDVTDKQHRALKPLKTSGGKKGEYKTNPDVSKETKMESDEDVKRTTKPKVNRWERRNNKRAREAIEGNISGSTGTWTTGSK